MPYELAKAVIYENISLTTLSNSQLITLKRQLEDLRADAAYSDITTIMLAKTKLELSRRRDWKR
jgi:hypothetical protein